MFSHTNCRYYEDCDYRNDVGYCPKYCVQYRHKDDERVVRCKDCRYYNDDGEYCGMWGEVRHPEHYCAEGDRESNE